MLRARPLPPSVLFLGLLPLAACRPAPSRSEQRDSITRDAGAYALASEGRTAATVAAILSAEDRRRADEIPASAWTDQDVTVRRVAARALARIEGGELGEWPPLLLYRALHDEDAEVAAWGAYGLGLVCEGQEETVEGHERQGEVASAVGARLMTLEATGADAGLSLIDTYSTFARSLGGCATAPAERALVSLLTRGTDTQREGAAYALGDIAGRRGTLREETLVALLSLLRASPPVDVAFYPWARMKRVPEAPAGTLRELAATNLSRSFPERIYAVRALARTDKAAVPLLAKVATDPAFSAAERNEAVRGLASLGEQGKGALRELLARVGSAALDDALAGDHDAYVLLTELLDAIGFGKDSATRGVLFSIANAKRPAEPASLVRRIEALRCKAASLLALSDPDADVLRKCAPEASVAFESARLHALVAGNLFARERRAAWLALARSVHATVREEALESIGQHPELHEAATLALSEALSSNTPGVVATAADALHEHPDRAMLAPAGGARHDAGSRTGDLDPGLRAALEKALTTPWAEDLTETRLSLMDAALALGLDAGEKAARDACASPTVTVRRHAAKSLAAEKKANAKCPPPAAAHVSAVQGALLEKPTRATFDSDVGPLSIVFEPELTPVAATRFVALARSGFFHEITVHRVVPGFVAQFGDPWGDGYGGSGALLRCETSPVPFARLDVGVALAGRDTGSGQLFVTLARTPHLDGHYARVGHAQGAWDKLTQGDVIHSARVE